MQIKKSLEKILMDWDGKSEIGGVIMIGCEVGEIIPPRIDPAQVTVIELKKIRNVYEGFTTVYKADVSGQYLSFKERMRIVGEWHTHPSGGAVPSEKDIETIRRRLGIMKPAYILGLIVKQTDGSFIFALYKVDKKEFSLFDNYKISINGGQRKRREIRERK